jgi:hypothetical protein
VKTTWQKILIECVFVFCVTTGPVFGEDAYLSDIVVTNTRDHLLVYFTVENCFTADMTTAIESGIETTFTFFIKLQEKRDLWPDKTMVSKKIQHSIRYDNLKKQYEVRRSEENQKAVIVKEFETAKKIMTEVVALEVVPLQQLNKGTPYQIRMMAEMDRIKLPLGLHYIFFFLSLWDFKTDWYVVDFKY